MEVIKQLVPLHGVMRCWHGYLFR